MVESRNDAFVNAPEKGPMPHVIVGDEAFPLKTYLLRPYPGKNLSKDQIIFNYRLSYTSRIVENAFGISAARFRVYQRRFQLSPGRLAKDMTTLFSGRTCPTMRQKKEIFF